MFTSTENYLFLKKSYNSCIKKTQTNLTVTVLEKTYFEKHILVLTFKKNTDNIYVIETFKNIYVTSQKN